MNLSASSANGSLIFIFFRYISNVRLFQVMQLLYLYVIAFKKLNWLYSTTTTTSCVINHVGKTSHTYNHVNYNTVIWWYIKYVMRLTIETVSLFTRFHHRKCVQNYIKRKVEWKTFFCTLRIVLDLIKGCSSISISSWHHYIIVLLLYFDRCATKLWLKIIPIFPQRSITSYRFYI